MRSHLIFGEYKHFSAELETVAEQKICSAHELSFRYDDEIDFKW